jgi:hypothetical protein
MRISKAGVQQQHDLNRDAKEQKIQEEMHRLLDGDPILDD